MKITFVLPTSTRKIIGGYKIIYEYANRLSNKGYDVTIVYNIGEVHFLKYIDKFIRAKIEPKWFELNKNVKRKVACGICNKTIPYGDIIFATAFNTAFPISKLNKNKGKKYYFIQGFENWGRTDKEVYETYKLGMKNIVISKWLGSIVNQVSTSKYIPNGIDFEIFNISNGIEKRNPKSIAMLYHFAAIKNSKLGLKVISRVREKYPDLKVNLFGCPNRPTNIPNDYVYIQRADHKQLKELYNQSAIFLCTSKVEGFGLTGAESMACGCALVSTDCQGILEYAENEHTALISEIDNEDELYKNIIRLIENDDYRIELAKKGYENIKKLDWNLSVEKLEKEISI